MFRSGLPSSSLGSLRPGGPLSSSPSIPLPWAPPRGAGLHTPLATTGVHPRPFSSADIRDGSANSIGTPIATSLPQTSFASSTEGASTKKVHFREGEDDGFNYLGQLKKQDPRAFAERRKEVEREVVQARNNARKQLGRSPMASNTAKSKVDREFRRRLRSENSSETFLDPWSDAQPPKEAPDAETEHRWMEEELKEQMSEAYESLKGVMIARGMDWNERDVQSIARGMLDAQSDGLSSTFEIGWAGSALAAVPEMTGWVNASEEVHKALYPYEKQKLKEMITSQGADVTDEELEQLYKTRVSRYHRITNIDQYPDELRSTLTRSMSMSTVLQPGETYLKDSKHWTAGQRKHIGALCDIQDAGRAAGESEEVVQARMQAYTDKHRKDKAVTIENNDDDSFTATFNGNDLDSGRPVKATLPDGSWMTVTRRRPTLAPTTTEQQSVVDTSRPNPFAADDTDRANWEEFMRQEMIHEQSKKEKAQAASNLSRRSHKRKSLKEYFGSASSPTTGGDANPTSSGMMSLDVWARRGQRLTEASAVEAICQVLAVDRMTQGLEKAHKLASGRASAISMWILDSEGAGWSADPAQGKVSLSDSMLTELSASLEETDSTKDVKPEQLISTALQSCLSQDDSSKSWDGQAMEAWARQPHGRPGTAEPLSLNDVYKRIVSAVSLKDVLQEHLQSNLDHTCSPEQLSAITTFFVDAEPTSSAATSISHILDKLKHDRKWTPGDSDWPIQAKSGANDAPTAPAASQAQFSNASSVPQTAPSSERSTPPAAPSPISTGSEPTSAASG